MDIEIVSLNEVQDRFYEEDIELLTSTEALVEITVLSKLSKKRHPQVQLRFGRPADTLDKRYPAYAYLANTEFAETKRDIEIMFDLRPDEAIWTCGEQSGLTFDVAWKCKERAKQNIVAVKRRAVEVALYRGQEEDGTIGRSIGIQMHFGEPGQPVEATQEEEDPYNYCAWMDSSLAPSGEERFTLDDISVAFGIDPAAKVWEVGEVE